MSRMPQMTTRRWMASVTVLALLLGCWTMAMRRQHFLQRAAAIQSVMGLFGEDRYERLEDGSHLLNEAYFEADGSMKEWASKHLDRLHGQRAAMLRKYRYAATHPWLPVEPDPPKPQRGW